MSVAPTKEHLPDQESSSVDSVASLSATRHFLPSACRSYSRRNRALLSHEQPRRAC